MEKLSKLNEREEEQKMREREKWGKEKHAVFSREKEWESWECFVFLREEFKKKNSSLVGFGLSCSNFKAYGL